MDLTLCWSPPPKPGRTLFVAFAYHGADRDSVRRGLLERLESPSARGHRIVHRDHYANPRPLPYVIDMIVTAAGILSPAEPPDLVIDRRYDASLAEGIATRFGKVVTADVTDPAAWSESPLAESRRYGHVVLVYPDALGLGCERGERRALRAREDVLVINGRRRAFRLEASFDARLRASRFLARTRVVERVLALLVRAVAGALAWMDQRMGVRP